MDMRSVLDKIAESLEGDITIEPDWLSEHVGVMPEDCVRIDPPTAPPPGSKPELSISFPSLDPRIITFVY